MSEDDFASFLDAPAVMMLSNGKTQGAGCSLKQLDGRGPNTSQSQPTG